MLTDKLPLWYQIAQILRAEILARHGEEPERLPTEQQLAERFAVSVITIRQALKAIQDEGLIVRKRRHGTFTDPRAFPRRPLKLLGSIEAVFAQQASEETLVLERALRHPLPAALKRHFPNLKEAACFRRLRLDDGEPQSYAVNHVLPELGRRISAKLLRTHSMTQVLREDLGVRIRRIDNSVEARLCSPEVAKLLSIETLSPVLFLTGISYDPDNRVLDVAQIWYRADRYRFSVGFDFQD